MIGSELRWSEAEIDCFGLEQTNGDWRRDEQRSGSSRFSGDRRLAAEIRSGRALNSRRQERKPNLRRLTDQLADLWYDIFKMAAPIDTSNCLNDFLAKFTNEMVRERVAKLAGVEIEITLAKTTKWSLRQCPLGLCSLVLSLPRNEADGTFALRDEEDFEPLPLQPVDMPTHNGKDVIHAESSKD
ncbi:hypothetical protein OROGR_012084 [Orobanche gracilis]